LGTINVTGTDGSGHASTFDLGSAMIEAYIGTSGTAVVNVTDGGYLYTKKNMVGNGSSANTTVTVSGTGSKWENRFDQYIGQGGTATLNILDGGWVQNEGDYLTIGNYGTAEGTVTVSGTDGTTASRLTGKLRVGGHFGAGTGTLKIADGGVVRITELRMSKAGGSGEIYMTNGGMLALDGDLDADLGTFLADIFIAEVQGDYTDEIKYGVPGNWADLTSTTSLAGIGSLTYYGSSTLINGVDMNGYTVLTITVPEPATLIVLVGGLPLVLRRKRS